MAPRIRVPANFGREHINSEVHGNLILKLKDGGQIKTNSMIMSMNSPVIDNLTTNMFQSTLEVDDFENKAVDCFVDSMYTGEIEKLEKPIFEEVNKMAHAFEVSWLGKRCLKFYRSDILNFDINTYDEVLFACEIASRAHTNLKQSDYVRYFVETAVYWNIGKSIFLQRYMADFALLSKRQMDMSLAVARNDLNLAVGCLVCHLSVTLKSKGFDKNSLYFLEKFDILKFARRYPSFYQELQFFIIEISEISNTDGIKPILEKLIEASKCSNNNGVRSRHSRIGNVDYDSSDFEDSDDSEGDEVKDRAVQTSPLDKADWRILQSNPVKAKVFMLPPQEPITLEVLTTKNDPYKCICFSYVFVGKNWKFVLGFSIQCEDTRASRWSYMLKNCTVFTFGENYLENVPNHKVKLWKVTKTATHMKLVCNDVTVLNFNFETDSIESYHKSVTKWSGQPNSVTISSHISEYTFLKDI